MSIEPGVVASSPHVHRRDGEAVLALPVAPAAAGDSDVQPREGTADATARYGIDLGELAARHHFSAAAGLVLPIDLPQVHGADTNGVGAPWQGLIPTLMLVGVGAGTAADMRLAGAGLARAAAGRGTVVTAAASLSDAAAQAALVEGYLLGAYQGPRWASGSNEPGRPGDLVLLGDYDAAAVRDAQARIQAVWLARDLARTPANIKTPAWLEQRLVELASRAGIRAQVLGPQHLAGHHLGALMAVGAGATCPPRMVILEYRPAGTTACTTFGSTAGTTSDNATHVALVGVGLTYSTGGLALYKREAMATTPAAVSGAAVAAAVVVAAAQLGLPIRISAVLPLAEQATDATSLRPGDIIRTCDGTAIEVRDARGASALLAADALAFATHTYRPDLLIDLVVGPEAAAVALGRSTAALYSPDAGLRAALAASGNAVGEPLWPMPLVEDYATVLASPIADTANASGDPHVAAGSALGALFLQRFAGNKPWAHIDLGGVVEDSAGTPTCPKGATGFGVRALLAHLAGLG